MTGLLVPPWYEAVEPSASSMTLATFIWGFSSACAVFAFAKAVIQTYKARRQLRRVNAYIAMVWLEWSASVIISVMSWLFLDGIIEPRCA